jgi:ERF superfamily
MTEYKALRPALAAALAELSNVPRSRTANAGTYSYSFADLGDVFDVVRPVLAKYGIGVDHDVAQPDFNHVTATTVFMFGEEELYRSPVTLSHQPTPQGFGSALTYARRYSLTAACGLATEDDDGASAARNQPTVPDFERRSHELGWDDYDSQVEAFRQLVELTGDLEAVRAWVKGQHITRDTLTRTQAQAWMQQLAQVSELDEANAQPGNDTTPSPGQVSSQPGGRRGRAASTSPPPDTTSDDQLPLAEQ